MTLDFVERHSTINLWAIFVGFLAWGDCIQPWRYTGVVSAVCALGLTVITLLWTAVLLRIMFRAITRTKP